MQLFNSRWYDRIASLPPILISAVFHEYVLWAPARFVLPVLLIMFGLFGSKSVCHSRYCMDGSSLIPSGIMYFVKPNPSTHFWNYFLHFGLNIGVSTMVFVYATEFYARKTCLQEETPLNTFFPRFYDCFFA